MVCFPIGLDFLFIIFLLHLFLSWGIFLSISSSAISASTLCNHVILGLPTGILPSTLNSIHFFTQPSSPFLITCPYYPSLPPLITVLIGSNQFSQLFTCPSVFHLIICISALSNSNPTSTSKGLVSLPKVMLLLTQLTYTRLQWGKLNPLSRRLALHSATRLPSCSIVGAISTRSSAYSN